MARKKKQQGEDLFGTEAEMSAWCEVLYLRYPRKVAHKTAIASIRKAIERVAARNKTTAAVAVDWLVSRVKLYVDATRGQDAKYIPYPSTWFNQERYDDDDAEWEAWKAAAAGRTLEGDVAPGLVEKRRKMDKAEQERIRRELREAF